ncbi:MAG: redox-active disulfide protein 2 [Elusimicrobia bacterium]|nr:MAG: redox-active disulfide protein 2 [Elusimicrobiota bacterium]
MKVQVLGTGCAKCRALVERVQAAAGAAGVACDVEKVEDVAAIMAFGVMTTPALVVDGKVRAAGRLPSLEELKGFLTGR